MKLQFLGAAGTVTGSRTLIRTEDCTILVDCGLFQGYKELRERNWAGFPLSVEKIDAVVLTHAHIDHSGYLPILVRDGFKGPIYATAATRDLCGILLRDCGRIQEEDAKRANRYGYSKHKPALPLYTEEDAIHCLTRFKLLEFGKDTPLSQTLVVHASRAGHILGSAILTFRTDQETLVFSGDLGRPKNPIMHPPAQIQVADDLILESTYGNREHSDEDDEQKLGEIIRKTAKRGGVVLIPAFAVGRTQVVLYLLHQLKEKNQIPDIPIFLDSPMAQDATDIMNRHHNEHSLSPAMCHDVCSTAKYIQSAEDSKKLHAKHFPMVIISASGMAEGGRVLHHIKKYGPDHHNSIVFVGFQAPMTRGDRMLSGARDVKIHGEMIPIRAKVEFLETLSSHADYKETIDWLKGFVKPPRQVFLNHGEPEAAKSLKEKIENILGWRVVIPEYMDLYDL
jgi:metallo-beta-lactamase family protein